MVRQSLILFCFAALAAALAQTAAAQEYSDGGTGRRARGPAIRTPVELYGVHPPGPGCCPHGGVTPYYAPLSPTPTCSRWRTTCYTPYYCGYCPHRLHGPNPPPYGSESCPAAAADGVALGNYGPYTDILKEDTHYWRMGGNGSVPYGSPRPPHGGPPDLIDSIQAARGQGAPAPASPAEGSGVAVMPSAEK